MSTLRAARTGKAYARFFLRIGQVGRANEAKDDQTLPLFPLQLIMDAEGLLAGNARHLVTSSPPAT